MEVFYPVKSTVLRVPVCIVFFYLRALKNAFFGINIAYFGLKKSFF